MANDLSFGQLSTVLAAITGQATGTAVSAPVDTSSFITVAQTALKTGYDPLMGAISQVLSKTIFSVKPYYRKFGGLQVTNQQYGNHVRKLQVSDKPFENDDRLTLVDGQSIDPFKVNKPNVLQTNYYGAEQYQKSMTVPEDQLDSAFHGPEEFASFLNMITTNASDMIEQAHESTARMTVANMIGGRLLEENTPNVIHLLTEYKAATGLSTLTATTVMQPANFPGFIKWVYARIAAVSAMMTERSALFHTNITGHTIMRHSAPADQLLYMYAPGKMQTDAMVLSDAYHDNYLKFGANEIVNYWQSIKSPDKVDVKPVYLDTDGSLINAEASTNMSNVFALLADRESMGYTVVNERSGQIYNPRGGYSNIFWHFTDRFWNDFSENSVVFLLD